MHGQVVLDDLHQLNILLFSMMLSKWFCMHHQAHVVLPLQVVQPAVVPPPPFKNYVRKITTRTTEMLLQDLQAEGKRLREGSLENFGEYVKFSHATKNEDVLDENSDYLKKTTGSRRKSRKSRWRMKASSSP